MFRIPYVSLLVLEVLVLVVRVILVLALLGYLGPCCLCTPSAEDVSVGKDVGQRVLFSLYKLDSPL